LEAQSHASISELFRKHSEALSFSGAAAAGACDASRVSIIAFQFPAEVCGSCAVQAGNNAVKTIVKIQTRAMASPPCENSESAALSLSDKPKVAQLYNCIRTAQNATSAPLCMAAFF
jgi:hypothetical protein